jgi:Ca-activated chloride channel homolog
MAPGDRLTLIAFAQQPRVLAEDASREAIEKLLAAGTLRHAAGSADLVSAIQSACAAVRAVPSDEPRHVVFVTAGRAEFDGTQLARSSAALLQLVAANIPWQIVRLSAGDDDLLWNDLARTAQGRTSTALSADDLSAALLENLTGLPQTVAQGVSARITFNPKMVTSYRLLGHESTTLSGDAGDALEVDLQGEQTATNLFELWLKPTGTGEVALVELLWRDPSSGQPRRMVRRISRDQIVASFAEAPPWLQQGILAASTAEFLRGSYYVPNSHTLDQLLELAGEVDPRAAESAEFQALLGLLQQAARLR